MKHLKLILTITALSFIFNSSAQINSDKGTDESSWLINALDNYPSSSVYFNGVGWNKDFRIQNTNGLTLDIEKRLDANSFKTIMSMFSDGSIGVNAINWNEHFTSPTAIFTETTGQRFNWFHNLTKGSGTSGSATLYGKQIDRTRNGVGLRMAAGTNPNGIFEILTRKANSNDPNEGRTALSVDAGGATKIFALGVGWERNWETPPEKFSVRLDDTNSANLAHGVKVVEVPYGKQEFNIYGALNVSASGVQTPRRIANAIAHFDGRVYISENGGTEAGFDDPNNTNYQEFLLWVEEGIVSTDLALVELTDWPDYVFDKDYSLPSLKDVETTIKEKGHLHTMPSAKEIETNGFKVSDMTKRLLKTIEELTLHTINQEKKLESQNKSIMALTDRLSKLESKN